MGAVLAALLRALVLSQFDAVRRVCRMIVDDLRTVFP